MAEDRDGGEGTVTEGVEDKATYAESRMDEADTRCGYVAIVGRPNAGKSTLMNALVGEKLSIVSAKAQTTWRRVTGIRTAGDTQMIFLDTPGLLSVRDLHQRSMLGAAHEALEEADAVLLVVDGSRPLEELRVPVVRDALAEVRVPIVLAFNKMDQAGERALEERVAALRAEFDAPVIPISAARQEGLDGLVAALRDALPRSPFLYPPDDLALDSVRFFVAELVRETVFEQFDEEIPWSVATEVEEFRESEDPVYIAVRVHVERNSQKPILIGKKGAAIRELGRVSREKIETLLERPVYLDLWVKPLQGWRRKRQHLARLGYRLPDESK
jgi:GTP-binding protein Era